MLSCTRPFQKDQQVTFFFLINLIEKDRSLGRQAFVSCLIQGRSGVSKDFGVGCGYKSLKWILSGEITREMHLISLHFLGVK